MPATPTRRARRKPKAGVERKANPQAETRASLYDEVTRRIIAELEAGRFPWVQPWGRAEAVGLAPGLPRNALTGRNIALAGAVAMWPRASFGAVSHGSRCVC